MTTTPITSSEAAESAQDQRSSLESTVWESGALLSAIEAGATPDNAPTLLREQAAELVRLAGALSAQHRALALRIEAGR